VDVQVDLRSLRDGDTAERRCLRLQRKSNVRRWGWETGAGARGEGRAWRALMSPPLLDTRSS
jgi:hypothetical protein